MKKNNFLILIESKILRISQNFTGLKWMNQINNELEKINFLVFKFGRSENLKSKLKVISGYKLNYWYIDKI